MTNSKVKPEIRHLLLPTKSLPFINTSENLT